MYRNFSASLLTLPTLPHRESSTVHISVPVSHLNVPTHPMYQSLQFGSIRSFLETQIRQAFSRDHPYTISAPFQLHLLQEKPQAKALSWFKLIPNIHSQRQEWSVHVAVSFAFFFSLSIFLVLPLFHAISHVPIPALPLRHGTKWHPIPSTAETKISQNQNEKHSVGCAWNTLRFTCGSDLGFRANEWSLNEVIPLMLAIFISPTSRQVQSRADQRRSNLEVGDCYESLMLRLFSMWR